MILKAKREKGSFLCYSKCPVRDKELSLEAKGLLSIAMDKSPKHTLTIEDVRECCSNGKFSIKAAMDELIKAGYVKESRCRDSYGKLGAMNRDVSDMPLFRASSPQTKNRFLDYGQSKINHEKMVKKTGNRASNPQTKNRFLDTLNNKRLNDLLLRILNSADSDNFCHQVFEYIREHMDKPAFGTWIRPLSIKIINGRPCVVAPDALSSRWIQSNFIGIILDAFSSVSGCEVSRDDLTFTVYEGGETDANNIKKPA